MRLPQVLTTITSTKLWAGSVEPHATKKRTKVHRRKTVRVGFDADINAKKRGAGGAYKLPVQGLFGANKPGLHYGRALEK
jgi:hypothetical protein